MRKTFVMRGKTASGTTEVLNFGKYKAGYAYKLTEFQLYPNNPNLTYELIGTLTAGKTAVSPIDIDFNNDGLIGCTTVENNTSTSHALTDYTIINDTYIVTQNLILMVQDTAGGSLDSNWQCRFESVKMTGAEEAAVNYKQFAISDE